MFASFLLANNDGVVSLDEFNIDGFSTLSKKIDFPDEIVIHIGVRPDIGEGIIDSLEFRVAVDSYNTQFTFVGSYDKVSCDPNINSAGLDLSLPSGCLSSFNGNVYVDKIRFRGVHDEIGVGTCSVKCVEVPDGAKTIINSGFYNCSSLSRIDLPSSISSIEEAAFALSGLKSIELKNGLQSLGDYAFNSCPSLGYVVLPDSLTSIGEHVFEQCDSLRYIYAGGVSLNLDNTIEPEKRNIIIKDVVDSEPLISIKGSTDKLSSSINPNADISITSKVDIDMDSVKVINEDSEVKVSQIDDNTYGYTTHGASFHIGKKATGNYTVYAKDILGNELNYGFNVRGRESNSSEEDKVRDTEKPKVQITGAGSNGYYQSAKVECIDNKGIDSVFLDGVELHSTTFECNDNGSHKVVVKDIDGNESKKSFIVDNIKPDISGVSNGKYYNKDVRFNVEDENLAIVTLNGEKCKSNLVVKNNGKYELVAQDKCGNVKKVTFYMDKKTPTVTGVHSGGKYKKPVQIKSKDNRGISYVKLNGKKISNSYKLAKSGVYRLVIRDKAGNKTTVKFTLDRSNPYCNVKNNSYRNRSVTINAKDKISGIKYIKLDGKKVKNKTKVKKEGKHVVVLQDKVGNKRTIKFVIDKKKPTCNIKSQSVVKSGTRIKASGSGSGIKYIKLDGKKIKSNTKVTKKGSHKLIIQDKAGNKSTIKFKVGTNNDLSDIDSILDTLSKYLIVIRVVKL